jgi:hypothetical protein
MSFFRDSDQIPELPEKHGRAFVPYLQSISSGQALLMSQKKIPHRGVLCNHATHHSMPKLHDRPT